MKKLNTVLFLLFITSISSLYSTLEEHIYKTYSLMIRAHDLEHNVSWALVQGRYLKDDPITISGTRFKYGQSEWQELCAMWEDVAKPEDVGCYPLEINGSSVETNKVECTITIPTIPKPLNLNFNLILDRTLHVDEVFLVLNEFVEECRFRHKERAEQKVCHYYESEFNDFDFDEEEIIDFKHSASPPKMMIYVRQLGIGLLMQYLAFKNYLSKKWSWFKKKVLA